MKRINRNPIQFNGLGLFSEFLLKKKISIKAPGALSDFLNTIRGSTEESLNNDIVLFGHRTEAMFEMMVASLGRVVLLKQEDQGEVYVGAEYDVAVPDFRVLLEDGSHLLIEVKNIYNKTGREPLKLKTEYLKKLETYADLMKCELLVATYWARWNLWTLVPTSSFNRKGPVAQLQLTDAMPANRMAQLGDVMIGTRAPLRLRFVVTELGRKSAGNEDERLIQINEVQLLSETRVVSDPVERRIALMLIFYGGWEEEEPHVELQGGKAIYIDYIAQPREEQANQEQRGFETVGYLSQMIARMFRFHTSDKDGLTGIRMSFKPGEYSQLIPDDHKSKDLPLWRFVQQPNTSEKRASK